MLHNERFIDFLSDLCLKLSTPLEPVLPGLITHRFVPVLSYSEGIREAGPKIVNSELVKAKAAYCDHS